MSSWISPTPRLEQGLEIVSQLDNSKFRLLVNHICQGLYSGTEEKIFSAAEEEKLMLSLDLKKNTLTLLLDTITLIYSQAAFSVVKPALMESVLKESFPISEEKVSIFVNAWVVHAKRIVNFLRQKSIFPTKLDDVNWSFNVPVASPDMTIDTSSSVLLQLNLNASEISRLTIEMDPSHVVDLYNKLEKIQSQLDALK